MRIYLAGPMTGIPFFNYPAFADAAHKLRAQGHEVHSPAEYAQEKGVMDDHPFGDETKLVGFERREALLYGLTWICDHAEGIVMLPGWKKSSGAQAEHALAIALGLGVVYLA